jgi:type I restriction enzyme, S subunit
MAGEWKEVSLDQVYDFRAGLSKPRSEFGSGYEFLSFKDVFYNTFVPDELTELVNSTERERMWCSVERGDVFLTRTSETVDELGMSSVALRDYEGATFNGFTKRLRPKTGTKIVPEYAGYYFRSPKFRREVTALSSLSTRASLNNEMLARLTIVIPPADEQSAIGHILKTFDDKIGINRRMNQTLEAIAHALFKSWFVDFDPVRAKSEGRNPGLPPHLADLFPDSFEESELGWIPSGWRVTSLGELFPKDNECVLTGPFGSHLHAHDYRDEGVPLILVKHVDKGQIIEDDLPLVGQHKVTELERYRLQLGDIVFTRVGAVGRSAFVFSRYVGWLISGQTLRVRVPDPKVLNSRYLAQVYKEPFFVSMVENVALGTTRPSLNTQMLRNFRFLYPAIRVQDKYVEIINDMDKLILSNQSESRTLGELRDTLLPKLISGELRLEDAERFIRREEA